MDGKCTEKVLKEREPKKKTKKKKKAKKGIAESGENTRTQFPWYHILGPLTLAVVTYKYSQPTLVTSAIIVVVAVVAALHGQKFSSVNVV